MTRCVALAAALTLAACHRAHEPPATVTADQDRQLNDAAASLDANGANASATSPSNAAEN